MRLDVTITAVRPVVVYESNITHNLNKMASEAGLYLPLWHPEELIPAVSKAEDLIPHLKNGLANLIENKAELLKYNNPNNWGTHDQLVKFVSLYLEACQNNPDGEIRVDR